MPYSMGQTHIIIVTMVLCIMRRLLVILYAISQYSLSHKNNSHIVFMWYIIEKSFGYFFFRVHNIMHAIPLHSSLKYRLEIH